MRTSYVFRDRTEAGRLLGERLAETGAAGPGDGSGRPGPVVLGLPRGGVPVAAAVAQRLGVTADVLVARKIGCPGQPELGVGAVAEGGEPVWDRTVLREFGLAPADLAGTVAREQEEIRRRVEAYRGGRPLVPVAGRTVVLVDDGLATGGTARAALAALARLGAARRVLAVPVAPAEAVSRLAAEADDIVVLETPPRFRAVGSWYRHFDQLTDAEVVAALRGDRGT